MATFEGDIGVILGYIGFGVQGLPRSGGVPFGGLHKMNYSLSMLVLKPPLKEKNM